MNACAPSDDLLELGHRTHFAVEYDQAARLRVNARGEQARGGNDDGALRFRVDEVAELRGTLGVVARDAHDVAAALLPQFRVLIDQRLAHAGRVLGIDTEHNRLLEGVAALTQERGDLAGH